MYKIILDKNTEYIIKTLESCGFEASAVGGAVRNQILGIPVTDFDITTSALPEEVKKAFKNETVLETGIKHGTVTLIKNKSPYEITTYRKETGYSDSRHPDYVTFVSDIIEDLARRDFTVNAIAFSPSAGLVDPFGGIADIKNRIIRAVGNPYRRFTEDALRILRALRFASVLSFSVENDTKNAAFILSENLIKISPERIFAELKKLICGDNALSVLTEFRSILETVIPINDNIGKLDCLPKNLPMRFAYLCGNRVGDSLAKLRADNYTKALSVLLSNSSPLPTERAELKKLISQYGIEASRNIAVYRQILFGENAEAIENILNSGECVFLKDLAVNGTDLVNIGIRGREVGKTLSLLLSFVHKNPSENKKELLLEKARALYT